VNIVQPVLMMKIGMINSNIVSCIHGLVLAHMD